MPPRPTAQPATGIGADGNCPTGSLHFPSTLVNAADDAPLDATAREVVVLIHGWTGKDSATSDYNRYEDAADAPQLNYLYNILKLKLAGSSRKLVAYRWEQDASTGGIWELSLTPPAMEVGGYGNAVTAAGNAFEHGRCLASRLNEQSADLRAVHFIAHSAGSWAAYEAAETLLTLNPYVVVQITLLDPFIPDAGPILDANSKTGLSMDRMSGVYSLQGGDRIHRLQNYFADDGPCPLDLLGLSCWQPSGQNAQGHITFNGPTVSTQEQFQWRSNGYTGRDANLQVDWGVVIGAPTYSRYYDYHSGPIEFYADTVAETIAGEQVPVGLVGGFWSGDIPFDQTQTGWHRSMFYESFLLPKVTAQPLPQSVQVGQSASFSVTALRATLPYQWFRFKDGQSQPLQQFGSTLTLSSVSADDDGEYVVRAANATGQTFSEKARLQVAQPSGQAPTVTTNSATDITQTSAAVIATVNPNGASTTLYFDYGLTASYGSLATYGAIGSGVTDVTHSSNLSNLKCGTTYRYQARAQNSGGSANGANKTFTTSACSPHATELFPTISSSGVVSNWAPPAAGSLYGIVTYVGAYPAGSVETTAQTWSSMSIYSGAGFTMEGGYADGTHVSSDGDYWVELTNQGSPYAPDFSGNVYYWRAHRSGGVWSAFSQAPVFSQQGPKLVGTGAAGPYPNQGQSVSLSADGNTAIVGGTGDNNGVGAAWAWTRVGGVWTQQGPKLVGTGAVGNAIQGYSVSLSADGNTAIVGGPRDNPSGAWGGDGAAWVWVRSGGVWTQQGQKLVASDAVGAAFQGLSVSLSADGNTAVIGGYADNGGVGAAWVWTRSGGVWTQQGPKLVGSGAVGDQVYQGISVSLSADGNTAIVGGHGDDNATGAAWVWTRNGGIWTQQGAKLVGSGAVGLHLQQGFSVSLSADGNTALVGGPSDDNEIGAAWIWTRSGGVWTQQGSKLVGSGTVGIANQGISVSLSADGNIAIVGGNQDNDAAGAAWVWARSGGIWTQQGTKLVGSDTQWTPSQGSSVALSGDGNTAIVGGPGDNIGTGAAWVFVASAPATSPPAITTQPTNQTVAVGANATFTVAASGTPTPTLQWQVSTNGGITFTTLTNAAPYSGVTTATLTITAVTNSLNGARYRAVATDGVGSPATSAAATLTVITNVGLFSQQGLKLVGTGGTADAQQGYSVSLSADGNTAIIGGPNDNNLVGAAWIWTRGAGIWTQGAKLVGSGAEGVAQQGLSVSLSADGNTAIIGGPNDNNLVGAAWIWARSGGVWTQQGAKLVGSGAVGVAQQGISVSLSADGNTAIVGGRSDNYGAGAAWVWTRKGGEWTPQGAKLVGSDAVDPAHQGESVSISGDGNTAIVGGTVDNNGAGAAWIWTRNGGLWNQQGTKLVGSGAVGAAQQGRSVYLAGDGNTAVVGGANDNNYAGAAWVWTRTGGDWTQQGTKLVGSGATGNTEQGNSVSLSGDGNTAVVGGYQDNGDAARGAAWVWTRSAGIWTQRGDKLVGSGAAGIAFQGMSVSLSSDGGTAIVGGAYDGGRTGAAWVFAIPSTGPTITTQPSNQSVAVGATATFTAAASGTPTPTFQWQVSTNGGATFTNLANGAPYSGVATSTLTITSVTDSFNGRRFRCVVTNSAGSTTSTAATLTISAGSSLSQQGPKLVGTGAVGNLYCGFAVQGRAVSISGDGNTAIVGGYADDCGTGAAWVWTRSGGVWTQQGDKLVGSDAAGGARQGSSVSLSADGNTAIVGGEADQGTTGAAWVWTRSGGVWTQQGPKLVGSGAVGEALQGTSVSLSADGNTAIVGGYADNSRTGAAWIWTRNGGVWAQQGTKLVGSGAVGSYGSDQGHSVSLSADGNTAIVGGSNDGDNTLSGGNKGAAWVWTRSGGVWTQQGTKLVGSGAVLGSAQGTSVSLSVDGSTAIVGGWADNGNADNQYIGAAWVWTRSGGVWAQQGTKLIGSGAVWGARQGSSVSLSADGNTAIVGGPYDSGTAGAAWIWKRNGGIWTQQGIKLVGSDGSNALQGHSVSLSADGTTAIVGGPGDHFGEMNNVGAAWVFAIPSALDIAAQWAYLRTAVNGGGSEVTTPSTGQTVFFHLNWQVTGSSSALNVTGRAVLDGSTFCTFSTSVSSGAYVSWCDAGWTATAGNHTLTWDLDYTNSVAESNESNNSATKNIGFGQSVNPSTQLGKARNAAFNADPVNTATGNYVFDHTDLSVPGRGIGLAFARYYNSLDATNGPLGPGWSHSYNVTLTVVNTDQSLQVRWGDGHIDYYNWTGSGYVPRYAGLFDSASLAADGTLTIQQKSQTTWHFNITGQLDTIVDRNGNAVALSYDDASRLVTVQEPGGRFLSLTYDETGRISAITDPLPRTVAFAYDDAGQLKSVTDVDGGVETYTYDGNRQMLTATDPRGAVYLTNTYDADKRVVTWQADAKGNRFQFAYDPTTGQTTITDPLGHASVDIHDDASRLIGQTDRLGHSVSYTYDLQNNRTSMTDQNGHTTQYTYDAVGNVTGKTDALGQTTAITYDATNNPLTRTGEAGGVTRFTYDAHGNLLTTSDPLTHVTTMTYDASGLALTLTDANSGVTTNVYDAAGNLTSTTNPTSAATTFVYDAIGRKQSVTDARGHTTAFTYDGSGRVLTTTDPLSHIVTNVYDANGNRTQVTDARGGVTTFAYDPNNLLTTVTDALGGITRHTYDALDRRLSTQDALLHMTSFAYDAEGRMIQTTDPTGGVTHIGYDGVGNRTSATDANNHTTTFVYDALSRLISTTDALGHITRQTYDPLGRVLTTTDAVGRVTTSTYDAAGHITQVLDPAGGTARYTYDAVGNRLTVTDPNSQITTLTYDAAGRLLASRDPLTRTTTNTYDAVGNRASVTDANGTTITYAYDAANRLTTITPPTGTATTFSYDAAGNRVGVVDPVGATSYTYDLLNRLTRYVDAYGQAIGYEYDAVGNRTALLYPDNKRVAYAFDDAQRMTRVTDWAGGVTQYTYDAAGQLLNTTNANGTTATTAFDNAGRLTTLSNQRADASVVASYNYTLDDVGNRTAVNQQEPLTASPTAVTVAYTVNAANQIQTAGSTTFASDANGNLTARVAAASTTTYAWDAHDRLTQVSDGATTSQYVYNGVGTRLAKSVGGATTRFVVDPQPTLSQVLVETDGAGAVTARYVYGLGLLTRIDATGTALTYHFDPRGSTVAMTDAAGAIVNRYAYDEFGAVRDKQETAAQPFQYVGQFGVMQETNGLLFMRARYYDATESRFLSPDSEAAVDGDNQTLHRYAYVLNQPVDGIDPEGRFFTTFGGAIIGAVTGGIGYSIGAAVRQFATGDSGWSWSGLAGNVVEGGVTGGCYGSGGFLVAGACGALGGAVGSFVGQGLNQAFGDGEAISGGEIVRDALWGAFSTVGGKYVEGLLSKPVGAEATKLATKFLNGKNVSFHIGKEATDQVFGAALEWLTAPTKASASSDFAFGQPSVTLSEQRQIQRSSSSTKQKAKRDSGR